MAPEVQTLQVSGMTCANCVAHVEKALRATPGVTSAQVNLKKETARVEGTGVPRDRLVAAVQQAGYGVKDPAAPALEGSGWKFWRRQ